MSSRSDPDDDDVVDVTSFSALDVVEINIASTSSSPSSCNVVFGNLDVQYLSDTGGNEDGNNAVRPLSVVLESTPAIIDITRAVVHVFVYLQSHSPTARGIDDGKGSQVQRRH